MDTSSSPPKEHSNRDKAYFFLIVGCALLVLASIIGIADNFPGIVSMLVGFFAVVLGIIYWFAKNGKRRPLQQLLYWAPRALCIVFAAFIAMFALDVFGEGRGFWETLLALLLHLTPTFLVLALLAVSWRREWIAGVFLPLLGALYIIWAWNKPFGVLLTFMIIAGPLVLTGALFLLNWRYRGELREKS